MNWMNVAATIGLFLMSAGIMGAIAVGMVAAAMVYRTKHPPTPNWDVGDD
jgi:hypothetical protein